MKKTPFIFNRATMLFFFVLFLVSCRKTDRTQDQVEPVSQEVLAKIKAMGFDTRDVQPVKGGYIVEGDIILTKENINSPGDSRVVRVANTEQYRTTNIITGLTRTITVSVDANLPAAYTTAVDAAIARYTAITNPALCLTFQRVASNGEIRITNANLLPTTDPNFIAATTPVFGRGGFPTAAGNPGPLISMNVGFLGQTPNANALTTIIAHELGHCIGFRHTDLFNRAFSCGGAASNEEQPPSGFGAIHIPGTPTGADANSWMLACQSATTNRPFNANDVIALRALYSCSGQPLYSMQTNPCSGIFSNATLFGNVGDVVVLRLSFGGFVTWNNQANGAGAQISLTAGNQSCSSSSPRYFGSGGFTLNCEITVTLQSRLTNINTTAVVHNSNTMFSSTATLTLVSVNGTPLGNQAVVCGGNSGGFW